MDKNQKWQESAAKFISVFCVVLMLALLVVLGLILKDLLTVFIFALCLNYLLAKPVDFFCKYIPSRSLSIFIVFVLMASILILVLSLVYPILEEQIFGFKQILPSIKNKLEIMASSINAAVNITMDIPAEAKEIVEDLDKKDILLGSFKYSIYFVVALIMTLVVCFYLLLDGNKVWQLFTNLFPKNYAKHFVELKERIDSNMNSLIIGQFKIASLTSLVMLITYTLIGSRFAILLAALQMLEFIPIFGTWLAFIPAVIIVTTTSGSSKALVVLFVYLLYSQIIRDHFVVPRIIGSAFGIHALAVIFGLMLGLKCFGILGIIVALPLIAILSAVVDYLITVRKDNQARS